MSYLSLTEFYPVLPSFTQFYLVLPSFVGVFKLVAIELNLIRRPFISDDFSLLGFFFFIGRLLFDGNISSLVWLRCAALPRCFFRLPSFPFYF